jgi:hypothetical protein
VLINDPHVGGFPATYWYADRWECPGCKHLVIVGRGAAFIPREPGVESFQFNG